MVELLKGDGLPLVLMCFITFRGFSKATHRENRVQSAWIVFCMTNTSLQWFQIMTKYVPNIRFGLVLGQKIVHHNDVQISLALFLCFKQHLPPTKNTKKHQKSTTPKKPINQKNSTPKWPPMEPSTVRQFHPWLAVDAAAVAFLVAGSVLGGVHSTARQAPTVQTTKRLPINRATARLHPA